MPGDLNYLDLQLNGYRGVDFNARELRIPSCRAACKALQAAGVVGVLATIITDDLDSMCARLERIAAIRREDPLIARMILGIHVEGPFLDPGPGFAGAHPPQWIRPADGDEMKWLVDAAAGLVRIVTLAPEHDPGLKVTRWLAERKIIVSAGHCNPSLDQLRAAIDAGLSMFTHLGNGCPMFLDRHDNVIQRVLSLAGDLGSASSATAFIYPTSRWRITSAACRQTVRLSSATGFPPPAWDRAAQRWGRRRSKSATTVPPARPTIRIS